jgi:N-acetylneuraminic acid mutarotase
MFRPAFAVVNNKLCIVGGMRASATGWYNIGRVDVYNPTTNVWTRKASIPRVEYGLAGGRVVVNGQARLEVIGGARPDNNLQYIP